MFVRFERKTPVLRPALQLKQSSLCGFHRSRDQGGRGSNVRIFSVKRASGSCTRLFVKESATWLRLSEVLCSKVFLFTIVIRFKFE